MARKKKETESRPNSIFKKVEVNSLNDIITLYLFFDFTQEVVNNIAIECGKFLNEKKDVSAEMVNQLSMQFSFSEDGSVIHVYGNNLLSSLWLIGVYPNKPEKLIDKTEYKNGDFKYKFYTQNKNLSIKPINNNESKPTSNP
jgi:hypothetical protein